MSIFQGTSLWSGEVLFPVGIAVALLLVLRSAWRDTVRDPARYVEALADAVDVHIPGWYEVEIPFAAIDRIELRARYSIKDMIQESFAWNGRVPERGEHVAIYCNRRVGYRLRLRPFNWQKTFRAKVVEPEQLVALAHQRLAEWRNEHPATANRRTKPQPM